ncbi:MAG: phage virion morphogenesis protein [Alphaproteobacteria bacterium]|nr:phage virion morphogenesis protein [Alphaproteobacteria bacterium]
MRSFVQQSSPQELVIGTSSIYAAIHQFGGMAGRNRSTPIPARPMLPTDTIPADWEHEIVSVAQRYLAAAMEGRS